MDISEVAKRSGVAASALRYYERQGLISSLEREGGRRRFGPKVLDQLALIALGQAAGFSLEEIRTMFTPDGKVTIDRAMLSAKADDLDRLIKRLKAMSEGLRHAAVCRAPSHIECPSFQRLLNAAAAGTLQISGESWTRRPRSLRMAATASPAGTTARNGTPREQRKGG